MKLTAAQTARLQHLTNARGQLTPSAVVADAKHKTSPLHALFEWDLKKAAQKYLIQRAREVIGAVTVVVTTKNSVVNAPMYVRDTTTAGREGYRTVVSLRDDPVNARESLIYTLETAAGHLRRAYDLAQPLGLSAEIDGLLAQIAGVQRVLKAAA